MNSRFDEIIDRTGTHSVKWEQMESLFGHADLLPMWVADMDFASPPEVVQALQRRAAHGIYGYTFRPEAYTEAIVNWQKQRHSWEVDPEWLCGSPGVVTALSLLVDLLTEPGDRIMLQVPVYSPFYDIVRFNGRETVRNPLRLVEGRYEMDLEQMERQIVAERVRMLLLCNPHNPVGRVWTRKELEALGEICMRHGVIVLSDEIHGDIVYSGHRHIPFASISEELAQQSIVCTAPSKTFNIAGLQTSSIFIANSEWRHAFKRRLQTLALSMENCFAEAAVEACYTYGGTWLDELIIYLEENVNTLVRFVTEQLPEVNICRPEGTYLVWMDARNVLSDPTEMKELMFRDARVAFSEGSGFGAEGAGFLRVNIGCPRSMMMEGLERFARAVRSR